MTQLTFLSQKYETDNIYTFVFDTGGLTWRAGQYLALVIPEVSTVLEKYEHWFSISSAPSQKQIHITVRKSSSPFKEALFNFQAGDSIVAHTIDGDFAWPEKEKPVFIAGGIGITPFISMLRQRRFENLPINADLYYFNRNSSPAFKEELNILSSLDSRFKVYYLNEKPLSLDAVNKLRDNWNDTVSFIAGPVPMVDRLGQALKQIDVPYKQDYYFGYDISNY